MSTSLEPGKVPHPEWSGCLDHLLSRFALCASFKPISAWRGRAERNRAWEDPRARNHFKPITICFCRGAWRHLVSTCAGFGYMRGIQRGSNDLERQRSIRPAQDSVHNRLLGALAAADWEILSPFLELVELKSRQVLHHAKTPMDQAFFIERGLVSVSARVAPEQWVEAWLIGSEGMTGLPIILGNAKLPPFRRLVQVGGSAFRISATDLLKARNSSPSLDKLFLRYASVVLLQTSQSGACNAHHSLKQRLARWLLLAQFALNEDELPITHAVLSRLLGVRRPSVTTCLGLLDEEGSIQMERGSIRVSDPQKLQATCCHCHQVIKQSYLRLIGRSGPEVPTK